MTEWATRRRQVDKTDNVLTRAPAARTIARLLTIGRDRLSKSETITVAAVEDGVPLLIEAREIIAAFQAIIRKRALDTFDHWMEQAKSSLIGSFANGILKDKVAVVAAITSPWSNGQTEGQITSSSSSNVRCTAAARLICFRLASSAPRNPEPPKVSQSPFCVPIDSQFAPAFFAAPAVRIRHNHVRLLRRKVARLSQSFCQAFAG